MEVRREYGGSGSNLFRCAKPSGWLTHAEERCSLKLECIAGAGYNTSIANAELRDKGEYPLCLALGKGSRFFDMGDLVEWMTDLEYEQFSAGEYRGLPDAPAFRIVEGDLPVVISAPHAVSQLREGKVKPSDDFTGPLALAAAEIAGCHAIVATRFDGGDPNWDPLNRCPYKQALVDHVKRRGIVAVLDVHGVPAASPFAIEIGSADGVSVLARPGVDEHVCSLLRDDLAPYLEKHQREIILNGAHAARGRNTVTSTVSRECGVVALQLEVSTPFRVPCGRKGHTPAGEAVPFTDAQLPYEIAVRRKPDPACVEATAHAIARIARELVVV